MLSQRPPERNRLDPLQYLGVINNQSDYVNNPDLKSERTTDFELGYQQVLNEKKNSSLQLSLFYRELKDLVQTTNVVQAYPTSYKSFSNVDFGTVKGLSLEFQMRRTNGLQFDANYTLQFAEGSGSSAGSGANLANSGQPNLRVTLPLDYDQRHNMVFTFDYRFGQGKDYKGPQFNRTKKGTQSKY